MSLLVEKTDGQSILARFIGMSPITGVQIGEYEMSLESFATMSYHFLRGGFQGWENNQLPEPIGRILTDLIERYELRDGAWVRKSVIV